MSNTEKCVAGKGPGELNVPNSAVELSDGNILIADKGNNRIIEVTKDNEIVFEYSSGLISPAFAQKYSNGYVVMNTNSNKIFFVSSEASLEKELKGFNYPTYADISGDSLLVADSFNNRIVEIDPDGNILWYYGDCFETDGKPGAPCKLGVSDSQMFKPSTAVLG